MKVPTETIVAWQMYACLPFAEMWRMDWHCEPNNDHGPWTNKATKRKTAKGQPKPRIKTSVLQTSGDVGPQLNE
jgi:hypothetical protein